MVIDKETFTELCVRLKIATDGILSAAKALNLVTLSDAPMEQHAWHQAIAGLSGTLTSIEQMEKMLTAILDAQEWPRATNVGSA